MCASKCRMYYSMTAANSSTSSSQPRAFDASELFSATMPEFETPARLDPYWDRLWASGSTVTWRSYATAEAHVLAGLGGLPKAHRVSETEAWELLESARNRNPLHRFLAVLGAWRTLTCEQAETLSGSRGTSNDLSRLVSAAFRAGLIELGNASAGLVHQSTTSRGTIYRQGDPEALARVLSHLTYSEHMSFTGGQGIDPGKQYDRHNILATELGIRVAEYCDVATVLGEKFSTLDLLAGSGLQLKPLTGTRSADLTIVRPDGLKIAVEVTASTSDHFAEKVYRWAKTLNDLPMNESGLMVVFVVAPPHGTNANAVRTATYKAVASAVRRLPGTAYESVASRIGIATWTDWFPQRHHISEDFFSLTVDMAAGMRDGAMTWRSVPLLSPTSTPFAPNREDLTAILDNAHLLWGTPVWLRDHRRAPSLIPTMLVNAGRDPLTIPFAQPRRPGKNHTPGKGKGAVADTKMPRRMLPYM